MERVTGNASSSKYHVTQNPIELTIVKNMPMGYPSIPSKKCCHPRNPRKHPPKRLFSQLIPTKLLTTVQNQVAIFSPPIPFKSSRTSQDRDCHMIVTSRFFSHVIPARKSVFSHFSPNTVLVREGFMSCNFKFQNQISKNPKYFKSGTKMEPKTR